MTDVTAGVREARATELERLGSDRGLLALTDADLSGETIRARLAASALAVAAVLESWREEDGPAGDAFAETAARNRDHAETIAPGATAAEADPVAEALSSHPETAARIGAGLVGYPLVADGRYLQAVSFFVNEADEASADEFRTVRTETSEALDTAAALLDEDDADAAEAAAIAVVDEAYEAYVESLDAMGLDPKTVC